MGFFMSVSRESNFFLKHRVDQKYFLYMHDKRYMHTRPKQIIVCLGLPVTL